MNREEFLRQMGLSTDDVADPDTVIANIKEKNLTGSAQAAYFSRPRDKPYPGFASATGSIPSQPVSEEAKAKYDKYVNNRVENVVNGRVDDADTHYMPAQKELYSGREDRRSSEGSKPSALDRERTRQREAEDNDDDEENEYDAIGTANRRKKDDFTEKEKTLSPLDRVTGAEQRRGSYTDKSDWISQGTRDSSRMSPTTTAGMSKGLEVNGNDDADACGEESRKGSDPLKAKLNDNISVAKRIAEASRSFYSAGEDDDDGDKDDYPRKQQKQNQAAVGAGPTHDYESKTAFLRSLGIEDPTVGAPKAAGRGVRGGGGGGTMNNDIVSSTITASVAMTGADRTSALSNAVAARRAQRKAAAAAAAATNGAGGGGGGGSLGRDDYQPPRSAPSAVDIVKEVASPNTTKTSSPQTANSNHLSAVAAAAYADLKRASSEPSRDQQQYARGGGGGGGLPSPSRAPAARVTITETVTYAKSPHDDGDSDDGYTAASFLNRRGNNSTNNTNNNRPPELNASRMAFGNLSSPLRSSNTNPDTSSRLRESPTKVVNGLLFGEGSAKSNNNTSNSHYNAGNKGGLSSAYDSSSNPSSLNNTLSGSRGGGGGGVEYDPETANLSVEELKTLGNKSFENGDFRKAVRYYSKAIAKDPSNPALYSNRSAAYLQASKQMGMDTRSMSLRDAEKTIELSPKWFKGYSRKGDALYKMELYDDAIEAYEMGLKFDEDNPSLIHSIGEARNANGGISRRDKKDTPWAIEQRTTINVKKAFGEGRSAHELVDLNRGELNDALGTLVLGDEYRKQQLERFRNSGKDGSSSSASARTSGNGKPSTTTTTTTSKATATNAREDRSTPPPAGGGKSLLDMIRSSSPEDGSIPLGAYPKKSTAGGGAEYGRRAGKEPLPESLTSDAASAYQQSLLDRYLARQQAGGGK